MLQEENSKENIIIAKNENEDANIKNENDISANANGIQPFDLNNLTDRVPSSKKLEEFLLNEEENHLI